MKVKYTATVLDTVYGEIEVMDHLDDDAIFDLIYEDIKFIDATELDWDVTEMEVTKVPHLIVED
jgi:hypothetical protein